MEIWVIFHSMKEKNVSNDLRFLNIQYAHKCQYFTEFTDVIICLEPSISYFPILLIFVIYST